ncbi:MAG: 3-methyl-2-oxobutanoate hydroxymethyltransferase [Nitrospirae bacterium]|nr:3-methyl-2-oxobutanoate hydroxymethyltransferase [Nitrospirota bacterium]
MTIPEFQRAKETGKKLVVVTAYDALFAQIVEQSGIQAILVGDSLGVVVQGQKDTLSVSMEEMVYHTGLVSHGAQQSLIIADMPFMSYQASVEDAVRNAGRLIQAGAMAVKLEGGEVVADQITTMTRVGIPVMGHLGMTPQSVNQYGGYRVQGRAQDQIDQLLADATRLEEAGAFALVLEAMPSSVAQSITAQVSIPTIGIGAGPHCDGQVLVLYDLLGLFDDFVPKFVKPYAHLKIDVLTALRQYKEEVENNIFPSDDQSYH